MSCPNVDLAVSGSDLKAHGVDVVAASFLEKTAGKVLADAKRHGLKICTYMPDPLESSRAALDGKPYERAVMIGGAYRGLAIDRHLFAFSAAPHDIVVEPPVYSIAQPYTRLERGPGGVERLIKGGHYFGDCIPVRAEVVVPEQLFDGRQHLRIIPCAIEPVPADVRLENDTVTEAMRGQMEIDNRHLVRLKFDLSGLTNCLLDKVGVAVYWASDTDAPSWKAGRGMMSVFSTHIRSVAEESARTRMRRWCEANGGVFPAGTVIAVRFGDECFNTTGHMNSRACSYPLFDYSASGLAAFAALAPSGVDYPRTWGFPEIYGADAYGVFLHSYHQACADFARIVRSAVREVAPEILVFRNTTRNGAWSYTNDHDGSGQELLARVFDLVHLDPYPVAAVYNDEAIPFDMGYFSGLSRRFGKPLLPWLQAHSYAPCGLRHVAPEQMDRMWHQHAVFAPDAVMWLGYGGGDPHKTDCTFPRGNPASWERARELHRVFRTADPSVRPSARLAVLRPYSVRACACDMPGEGWGVRNPADALLREFVRAWSVDHGLAYDVFEIPPFESPEARAVREAQLGQYDFVVSSAPYPGARVVGVGTEGKIYSAKQLNECRRCFAAEIAALKCNGLSCGAEDWRQPSGGAR